MTRSIVFAALLLAGPCLASETAPTTENEARAAATPSSSEVAAAEPAPAEDRMVCERRKQIGSNRIERVCMTQSQREAARRRAREAMERIEGSTGR